LTGLSIIAHYNYATSDLGHLLLTKVLSIILYFIIPALIIIPSSLITTINLHVLAVLIPALIAPVLSLVTDLLLQKGRRIDKYIMTAIHGYTWSVHFFIARQLLVLEMVSQSVYVSILVMSIIAVLSSCSTISFAPVKEFCASTYQYEELGLHSTLYMRLYLPFPLLLTELSIFYTPSWMLYYPILPYISFTVSLCFVTWWFGWISSLYNTVLFAINNLLNCLVFG
jgi:hypothetical protein